MRLQSHKNFMRGLNPNGIVFFVYIKVPFRGAHGEGLIFFRGK